MNERVRVYSRNNTSLLKDEVSFHWWDAGETSLHDHDYWEVFIITSGRVTHVMNDRASTVREGLLMLIRPEDVHKFIPIGDERCIHINLAATENMMKKLSDSLGLPFPPAVFSSELPEEDFRWFLYRSSEINMRTESDKESIPVIIRELLLRSLSILSLSDSSRSSLPGWLHDLTLLLHTPEYITLSAAEIYEKSGYSAPVVINAFRKHFGMSVNEYMSSIRMDRAESLLTTTGLTVLEIAERLGYSSLSHFTRLFRSHSGMTPSEYRRRHEGKH
ncbi:MAG: AraC family transcriptional regulator [Bullifex sp.]